MKQVAGCAFYFFDPEEGDDMFLPNFGRFSTDYIPLHQNHRYKNLKLYSYILFRIALQYDWLLYETDRKFTKKSDTSHVPWIQLLRSRVWILVFTYFWCYSRWQCVGGCVKMRFLVARIVRHNPFAKADETNTKRISRSKIHLSSFSFQTHTDLFQSAFDVSAWPTSPLPTFG
jgi:hypothetical protein